MGFITQNWSLLLVALLSGGYLLFSVLKKASSGGLTPAAVVQKINHEKAIVVDVREEEKFKMGHIVGARNLPMDKLKASGVVGLPKNKTLPLIVVCASGFTSAKALSIFKNDGYENVFSLEGGVGAWVKAELPLEEGASTAKDKKK